MSPKLKMVGKEGMLMKNIVAFTVVIIFVMAIVLIAFSCTASAHLINRSFSPTGGVIYYEGGFASGGDAEDEPAQNILIVYNWASGEKAGGEKIKFFTKGNFTRVTVGGPYTKSGKQSTGSEFDLKNVSAGGCWDAEGKKAGSAGYFKVEDDYGNGGWFQVIKQTFTLELGKKKVQEKESFNLTLKSNGREKGVMKLTIEDKDGYSIMNKIGDDIYEIRIDYKDKTNFTYFSNTTKPHQVPIGGISFNDSKLAFNTSKLDMNVGKYKIILEDYATEAEYSVDITVEKRYLKVECEEEVVRGEDIVITISSSFYDGKVNVTFGKEDPMPLTLNEGGEKRVKISTEDLDYGRYRVNVSVSEMMDIKYVMITKSKTSIEVPEDATVGEIVHIKGETSESGDSVIFVIDNVFESEATITDDKFKWDWDTSGELDGYRGIEVFILSDSVKNPFAIGDSVSDDWQREHGVAASSSIILFTPTFSMTVSKSIAKGDPLVINGTATGTDHVFIIVFNYKGKVMYPPGVPGTDVLATRTPVDDSVWTETIDKLNSGEYVVFALNEGEDGVTEAIRDGKWVIGGECKTMEQRVAILMDAVTTAGSDDLYELAYFSVTMPGVRLTVPETVEIGDPITVKVDTNVKDAVAAFVSLLSNADIIDETTVKVQDGRGDASFSTNALQPGKYVLTGSIKGEAYTEVGVTLENAEVMEEVEEIEEVEELISQIESVTEPETTVEAIESAGARELNESPKGQETPIITWDLLIAVIVAISISIVVRRRR